MPNPIDSYDIYTLKYPHDGVTVGIQVSNHLWRQIPGEILQVVPPHPTNHQHVQNTCVFVHRTLCLLLSLRNNVYIYREIYIYSNVYTYFKVIPESSSANMVTNHPPVPLPAARMRFFSDGTSGLWSLVETKCSKSPASRFWSGRKVGKVSIQ